MDELCGRCGHAVALHGRRGHGACRHGHVNRLALAVDAARIAAASGLTRAETKALVDAAWNLPDDPCSCKRATKPRRA
jgi:hypothetical protein